MHGFVHDSVMAIKTISIELDVYERLRRAKRGDRESFSQVLRRARWDDEEPTGASIVAAWRELAAGHPAALDDRTLSALERRAKARKSRPRPAWSA
jgi:hypothetical protein